MVYFESNDCGDSWNDSNEGNGHRYVFNIVINSIDPQNVFISSAIGAGKIYLDRNTESFLYVRSIT